MPPIQCLFLNVEPIADVRLRFKSNGEDYPPHIPNHITKVLEFHFVSTFISLEHMHKSNIFLMMYNSQCKISLY